MNSLIKIGVGIKGAECTYISLCISGYVRVIILSKTNTTAWQFGHFILKALNYHLFSIKILYWLGLKYTFNSLEFYIWLTSISSINCSISDFSSKILYVKFLYGVLTHFRKRRQIYLSLKSAPFSIKLYLVLRLHFFPFNTKLQFFFLSFIHSNFRFILRCIWADWKKIELKQ